MSAVDTAIGLNFMLLWFRIKLEDFSSCTLYWVDQKIDLLSASGLMEYSVVSSMDS